MHSRSDHGGPPRPRTDPHRPRVGGRTSVVLAVFLAACAGPAPDEASTPPGVVAVADAPDADVLMEADRAFSREVSEGGSAAWTRWFSEDGAMVQPGVGEIRGREAIAEAATFLDDPNTTLTWEPDRADIAASGDLGWTTGRYTSRSVGPDGETRTGTGRYVSIWRKQPAGSWRVVMDLGNPTDDPA